MWAASLVSADITNGRATFILRFDNGAGNVFDRAFPNITSPGDFLVEKLAAQELRNLEALDAYVSSLKPGPITPYKPPDPTSDQLAANTFFAMLTKLRVLEDAVAKGLLKPDDQSLSDLMAAVKAAYKDEYASDPRWR